METLPSWLVAAVAAAGVTAYAFDVESKAYAPLIPTLTPAPMPPVAPPL